MPGGLLQLIAVGAENIYLTGNPQITYFKVVYRRYTNFSMEDFSIFFSGQTFISDNDTTTFKCTIPRNGDLLYKTYLVFEIPDVFVTAGIDATKGGIQYDDDSGNTLKRFKWIKNLGTNMIERVSVSIGNQVIDSHTGEFIYLWNELNLPYTEKQIFYKMIGFNPNLYDPSSGAETYPFNITNSFSGGDQSISSGGPSIPGQFIIVPLCFWFCRNPGLSIPLVALQYHEVEITVEFRRTQDIYLVSDYPAKKRMPEPNSAAAAPQNFSDCKTYFEGLPVGADIETPTGGWQPNSDNPTEYIGLPDAATAASATFTNQIYDFNYKVPTPSNPLENIKRYLVDDDQGTVGNLGWRLNLKLLANYIFLENSERRIFANQSHQYLIEKTIEETFLGIKGNRSLLLKWFHPTKYIVFRARRSDVHLRNDWTNYTNYEDETLTEIEYYNKYLLNAWELDDSRWYPAKTYIQTQKNVTQNPNTTNFTGCGFAVNTGPGQQTGAGGGAAAQYLPMFGRAAAGAGGSWMKINTALVPGIEEPTGDNETLFISNSLWFPQPSNTGGVMDYGGPLSSEPNLVSSSGTNYSVNFYKDIKAKQVYDGRITATNYKQYKKEILVSGNLKFNGMDRFEELPSYYFNLVQPLSYGFQASVFGVYMYSFSLFPRQYEPSGACNLSRINKIELQVNTINPAFVTDREAADAANRGSEVYSFDFAVFGIQYNILRIMGGMGGLVFGN